VSTKIEISTWESAYASTIIAKFGDAQVHHEYSTGGSKVEHWTVIMCKGRVQGYTAYSREDAIKHTAEHIRSGKPFPIDNRGPLEVLAPKAFELTR
jgi:hypothetical protein